MITALRAIPASAREWNLAMLEGWCFSRLIRCYSLLGIMVLPIDFFTVTSGLDRLDACLDALAGTAVAVFAAQRTSLPSSLL